MKRTSQSFESEIQQLKYICQNKNKEISQLQQENQKLNDSINQSNLAKISALLKLEKLQQEKEDLIKWLEEEKENNIEKYKFWKEKKNYSMMGDYDTKTEILAKVLSKIKEGDK